jgi:flagellar basal body-associated protein FliL
MKRLGFSAILTVTCLLQCTPAALACAACFGQSDSSMARSLNASIFTLMGFIGVVLAGAASFFVFLAKKGAAAARAEQAANSPAQPQS